MTDFISLTDTGLEVTVNLPLGGGAITAFASFNVDGIAGEPQRLGSGARTGTYDLQVDFGAASQQLQRYLSAVSDIGMVTAVTTFEGLSAGEHTVRLRQATSDANDRMRVSNANLVVFPLVTGDGNASYDHGIVALGAAGYDTASTILEDVAGLSTTVDLVCYGRIFVSAAFNTSTDPTGVPGDRYGIWDLQIDGQTVGRQVERYLSSNDDIGAISLTGLSDLLAPGTHTITMRHATSNAALPIKTLNATLVGIALVDDAGSGYVIPAAEANFSTGTGTNSTSLINIEPSRLELDMTGVNGVIGGDTNVFIASSFNIQTGSGTGLFNYAMYDATLDGISISSTLYRLLSAQSDIGAGGIYGLGTDWSATTHVGYMRHATTDANLGIRTGNLSLVMLSFCSRIEVCLQPSPTPTPSITPTPTPSVTLTPSMTPTASVTPTPTVAPTTTPRPSSSPTPSVVPTASTTPTSTPPCRCYVVPQVGFGSGDDNLLILVDPYDFNPDTNETNIGTSTGTGGIETIAYHNESGLLYTVNYDRLGILDQATGLFSPVSADSIGAGYGAHGYKLFYDIDGMSFHPYTGILYVTFRDPGSNDLLIQVDLATGQHIPGAFNGDDYAVMEEVVTAKYILKDVDDIAFDPSDGQMYASINNSGTHNHLVIYDPSDGSIITDIGHTYCEIEGKQINDLEGLSFGCDGKLWGVTGNKTIIEQNDRLWEIDKTNAHLCTPRLLTHGTDYEAVTCGYFAPPQPTPSPLLVIIDSGDYDGDGTSDIAIFRGSSGLWAIRGLTRTYFGTLNDRPVSGDYDGDGTADIAIFREGSGLWALRKISRVYFGSSGDLPVPGDYDGDGSCDTGIFRSPAGLWAIRGLTRDYFGRSGDTPVPGYYAGDGSKDIGIFRAGSGLWALRGISRIYFGGAGDVTIPGDYDGMGSWGVGIFRPSSGLWAIRGVTRRYFGNSADQPIPADYDGSLTDDIGIFRSSSGLWAIRGISRVYYGSTGDIPVTR